MKTLDEVEPRIPITQADIPLTITQKGSYYFTANLTAAATAITVEVNDVTIDLMGYSLTGPGTGTTFGIHMNKRRNVEIKNGTVRSFGRFGIIEQNLEGSAHRVINVRVLENGVVELPRSGIRLGGKGHLVKDCTAAHNYGDGIYVDNGCTVTGNTVFNNGESTGDDAYGIRVDYSCTLAGNTVTGTGDEASGSVYGIFAWPGSTVTGNTARNNGYRAGGDVSGIHAGIGCTVTGNTAYYNGGSATGSTYYGIYLDGNNLVDQNTAYSNNGTNMDTSKSNCTYGVNHAT